MSDETRSELNDAPESPETRLRVAEHSYPIGIGSPTGFGINTVAQENRIEDRLTADGQPCLITVGEFDETTGKVVDFSPRGIGVLLPQEFAAKPETNVELYFQQFFIKGQIANTTQFENYVRLGISITERQRSMRQPTQ